jgi:hypothetical protein
MKITDTQRLEALARAMNTIVIYEGANRITFKSNREHAVVINWRKNVLSQKVKRVRHGMVPELLRQFADGLIKSEKAWQEKAKAAGR